MMTDINSVEATLQKGLENLELSKAESKGRRSRRLSTIKGSVVVESRENPVVEIGKGDLGVKTDTGKVSKVANRRFDLRPRKRLSTSADDNVNVYKSENKRSKLQFPVSVKKRSFELETIFEEPVQEKNGSVKLIGKSKVKRSITFTAFITKAKLKKRNAQIKKFKLKINKSRAVKLSLKEFELKMAEKDGE